LPNQWVETNQLFLENYLAILAKEAIAISKPTGLLTDNHFCHSVLDISYADGAGICKALRLPLCLARQSGRQFQCIYLLNKQGYNQTFIAKSIGRNKSTISRELSRNTGKRGYRHKQANNSVLDISYADGAGICKALRLPLCLKPHKMQMTPSINDSLHLNIGSKP
jgi:hypothetical protein